MFRNSGLSCYQSAGCSSISHSKLAVWTTWVFYDVNSCEFLSHRWRHRKCPSPVVKLVSPTTPPTFVQDPDRIAEVLKQRFAFVSWWIRTAGSCNYHDMDFGWFLLFYSSTPEWYRIMRLSRWRHESCFDLVVCLNRVVPNRDHVSAYWYIDANHMWVKATNQFITFHFKVAVWHTWSLT